MSEPWSPSSWRGKPITQVPTYADQAQLNRVVDQIGRMPPLIFAGEALKLKAELGRVSDGQAFLLQGGDCAEAFTDLSSEAVGEYFRVFLQMAAVLTFAGTSPVVKVGRIAGQFAKPRSTSAETIGEVTLPSYRGDIINSSDFTVEARTPDPGRLLEAYRHSASTLNLLRALSTGGYASLENAHQWMQGFVEGSPQSWRYKGVVERLTQTLNFMRAIGLEPQQPEVRVIDFYTSHESLLLEYEQPLTRFDPDSEQWFATSAAMLWIGDRTRQPDSAHIEFVRGIGNPIGLKCGPSLKPDELLQLISILNPNNEPGRLTLICRFGADKVAQALPPLIRAIARAGAKVVWSCDPMHGNTVKAPSGYKTRPFEAIIREVRAFFAVHHSEGTHAGGLHLEMTGKDVTECTGGARALSDADLAACYTTQCDPRLNGEQSLELAFLTAELIENERKPIAMTDDARNVRWGTRASA